MKKSSRVLLVATLVVAAFVAATSLRLGSEGLRLGMAPCDSAARTEQYDLRSLRILARTVLHIQGNYLDQDKVKPRLMLIEALEKVERLLPEVVVSPAPGESEENPAALLVTVGKASSVFDVGSLDTLWSLRERLKVILGYIQDHIHDPDVEFDKVEYAAINGMLSTLDPHSVLMDPDTYREMKVSTHGEFGGLGIVISIRDDELTVISPLEGTPAWRAGLKAKDRIVQIEDESTVNMRLDEAVKRLRGPAGAPVNIWVKRKGWSKPRHFTITREKITIKSVKSKLLDGGIGYVRLKSFQGHSRDQIREHLDRMRSSLGGELEGLILDLRDNPGGLLEQAIKVSDLFLDSGSIVLTVGKGNTIKEEHSASWRKTEKRYPMVVLVGPGSASASEIVAAALQNNDRAAVVGSETFGKGSVQVLYDMSDGSALKLTIAQYLTPGEVSIQGVGIQPDIDLAPVTFEEKRISFYPEDSFGEGDLDSALTNDAALRRKQQRLLVRHYVEPDPEPKEGEERPPANEDEVELDYPIRFARGLLAAAGKPERKGTLEGAQQYIHTQQDAEMTRIAGELAKLGVDWAQGGGEREAIRVTLNSDKENNRVVAGETISVAAEVRNTGAAAAHRVRGITASDNPDFDGLEYVFGRVAAGESKRWVVPVEIPKQKQSRTDLVTLKLYFGDEEEPFREAQLLIETEELPRPHFAYSWQVLDDKGGNGDGLLQRDEKVELRVDVSNVGRGVATDVRASLTNKSGEGLFLQEGRQKLKDLQPGETRSAVFRFHVQKKLNEPDVKLRLDIFDTVVRTGVDEELKLRVHPRRDSLKPLGGVVVAGSKGAELLAAASVEAQPLGRLAPSQAVLVTGRLERWYKVDVGQGRPAWVEAAQVAHRPKRRRKPKGLPVLSVRRQPPSIRFDAATLAVKVTDRDHVRVTGQVSDDSLVRDLYVFTQHSDGKLTKTRKLSFVVNERLETSPTLLRFSTDVPLSEGSNIVAVVARDGDRLEQLERMRVLRLPAGYAQASAGAH